MSDKEKKYDGMLRTRKIGSIDLNKAMPLTIGDWSELKKRAVSVTPDSMKTADPDVMISFAEYIFGKAGVASEKARDLTAGDYGRLMSLTADAEGEMDIPTSGSSTH